MARNTKIAAAQMGPIHLADSRDAVVDRLVALLRQAHGFGARWVVFPELALTTFFPRWWYETRDESDRFFEATMPNPAVQPLFDTARDLGVGFYLGYAEIDGDRRFNTSVLVGPDGAILGKYRKVHLPGHDDHRPQVPFQHLEKKYFEVGDLGFPVFPTADGVMGMAICNDRRWPETYRVMGLQGVDVIMLGYNTPTYNIYHPEPPHLRTLHNQLSLQAGAYQNGCWVVATAKCGAEDGFDMIGGSCIVAPTGEIVAQCLTQEDEVICYDCDLSLGDYIKTTVFNFAKHRRPEHYGLITAQTGATRPDLPKAAE